MFRQQHLGITGFQVVDATVDVEKRHRGSAMPALVTISPESNPGEGDWNIRKPGDHGNMMLWPLDPNSPPSRGAVMGSYSYAIPARKISSSAAGVGVGRGAGFLGRLARGRGSGQLSAQSPDDFLPLRQYGVLDTDYEALDIREAGPKDWIVLSTVGHGTREKIAFRSAVGDNIILIADHRSNNPPDLSTFVHDGRGNTHDPDRKAGLDTAWEVRKWKAPQCGYRTPESDEYSIAWVADASPDGKGFARIGFGDRDGLYSHMVSGPFIPSLKSKHLLEDTTDGPIIAGALSTNSYFRGSGDPFSAPLDFHEKPYPSVMNGTYEYEVHLHYDANKDHKFLCGDKPGLWRWFVKIPIGETPPCTPTKDYEQADNNGNPERSYAEDSRVYTHKKMIASGVYLQPRVNLTRGRIPDRVLAESR